MFLFVSGLLAALAGGIEAAFAVYFDSYFWGLDLDEMLTRGLCLYLSPIFAIILAPFFSIFSSSDVRLSTSKHR